jgi:hypothetical protein
LINPWV